MKAKHSPSGKKITRKTYDKDQYWKGQHILIMYTNDSVLRTRSADYIKQGGRYSTVNNKVPKCQAAAKDLHYHVLYMWA